MTIFRTSVSALALTGLAFAAMTAAAETAVEEQGVVVVTGQRTEYRPGDAAEVSKNGVSDRENPQATSVVTQDLIANQGATQLADALRNVAGISRSSTYGFFDAYQMRGYDAAYGSVYLDGLKNGNVAGELHELGGLEQVEVIKGPASGLYGASPLGGVVNLVSKRPRAGQFLDVRVGAGSFGSIDAGIDANGVLGNGLTGRLNLIYRDGDQFVDYSHVTRLYVAPALKWSIGEDTTLTLLSRFQRDDTNPWSPTTAWGTLLPNPNGQVPFTLSINDDDEKAYYDQTSGQVGYELIHRFSDAVTLTQNVRWERSTVDWDNWLFASGISADQTTIGRYLYGRTHYDYNDIAADTRLTFAAATGSITHRILIGFDYSASSYGYYNNGLFDPWANPLDLFNPDYSVPLDKTYDSITAGTAESENVGLYIQDHIRFTEAFTVTLGGRWDKVDAEGQRDDAFSPTIGAAFALNDETSLYVNAARSFTPNGSWYTTFDGQALPPETGKNVEAGVKHASKDGKLSGLVSVFRLTRQNVPTDDPEHPFFYIVTGEQQSQGVEIEGQWRPNPQWHFAAAYAYTDAKVTDDEVFPIGMKLPNVPEHNLNLWGQYTIASGVFKDVSLSAGLLYNSDKYFYEWGDGVYPVKGYILADIGAAYRVGDWKAQLNIRNLFDERYISDACCLDRITPGAPRTWQVSLSRRY